MTLATSLIYGFMHLSKGRSKEETEFLEASTGLNPRIFRNARQTFVIISFKVPKLLEMFCILGIWNINATSETHFMKLKPI